MKKIYLLASMLLIGGAVQAQLSSAMRYASDASYNNERPTQNQDRAPGDVIGSVYDFSTPANWVMTNNGSPSADWVIGTTPPAGSFSTGMGAIASTSGGNFAMFDSDGVGSASSTQDAVIELANSVNMTGFNNVSVRVESYYRHFQGFCYMEVSNDGSAWTQYPMHANILLNESTTNPETVEVNVSSVAGNQGTVWVRFRYVGAWDYAWMIDDVAFVEGYDNQLILDGTYMSSGVQALDYYIIPESQVMATTFGADVLNNGANDQPNTAVTVSIDGSTHDTSTPVTVPAFGSDSLEVTTTWTPTAGNYTVDFLLASDSTDQAPNDNDDTLEQISVGGIVYARDNGISTGAVAYLGSNPVPTICGNYFEMGGNMEIGKIQVGLGNGTSEGEVIYAEVRVWDGTDFVFVENTADHVVGPGEPGNIVTLTLGTAISAVAGELYMIGGAHYGSSAVSFLTAQVAPGAIIYNDGQASQQNSVFIVRAEEVFVGLEEEENVIGGLHVYPNPANQSTVMTYSISQQAKVSLTMTDLSGKIVYTENFGTQTKGQYQHDLSTVELSNGVYFYTLNVGNKQVTKKFVVQH